MPAFAKPGADFSRWCAGGMIIHLILKTHPPHNSRSDAGDASHNDERGK
jgi:hypothetical protein